MKPSSVAIMASVLVLLSYVIGYQNGLSCSRQRVSQSEADFQELRKYYDAACSTLDEANRKLVKHGEIAIGVPGGLGVPGGPPRIPGTDAPVQEVVQPGTEPGGPQRQQVQPGGRAPPPSPSDRAPPPSPPLPSDPPAG